MVYFDSAFNKYQTNLVLDFNIKNPITKKLYTGGNKMDEKQNEEKTMPEHKIRFGSVKATIWKNIIKSGKQEIEVLNTSIEKSYKDSDDNWKTTNSYNVNDLPKLIAAATEAYIKITKKSEEDK